MSDKKFFRNIIFDLDGTLVDSAPGIVFSIQSAVEKLSGKKPSDSEIVKLIGTTLDRIMASLLDVQNGEMVEKGIDLFKKDYGEKGVFLSNLYPGVREALENLKNESRNLFVLTNKIEAFADKIAEFHGIKKYFTAMRGTSGRDSLLKKADYLARLVKDFNLEAEKTVMVGDTTNDIAAGKENSLLCVGVTYGYGLKDELQGAGADILCDNLIDLNKLI